MLLVAHNVKPGENSIDVNFSSGRSKDEERSVMLLSEARAIDAFACHFLTDAFASGHIR
jgi:hypothetical protein